MQRKIKLLNTVAKQRAELKPNKAINHQHFCKTMQVDEVRAKAQCCSDRNREVKKREIMF